MSQSHASTSPLPVPHDRPLRDRPHRSGEYSSVLVGSLWMVGLSLALFFLPAINGFIAGVVGGYKVGTVGRALTAAILPAIAVSLGLWLMLAMMALPVVGAVAGLALGAIILLADLGLFLGAIVGAALRR